MPEVLEGEAVPQRLDIDVCRAIDHRTELRADDGEGDGLGTLVGEFSLFNEWYEIASYWEGHFLERIVPGAFKRTINNRSGQSPVRVLLEHGYDPVVADKPLGVPTILEERDNGPYAETPLLDTSYNRDLAPALAAGAYGQSFRFQVLVDEWVEEPEPSDYNPKGLPERTIKEVRLIEFGPTVFPASPATNGTTGLRSLMSTTDDFYERLSQRDSARYESAVRSVRSLRAPVAPERTEADPAPVVEPTEDAPEASTTSTEDPQKTEHSPDSAPDEGRHSEDPPPDQTHSEDTHRTTEPPTIPAGGSSVPEQTRTAMDPQNMTVEERVARQSEIRARLSEIQQEFAASALPAETQIEWDGLRSEFVEHEEAIEADSRRRQELADIVGNEDATETGAPSTAARTASAARGRGQSPTFVRKNTNIYDLAEVRSQARSVEELPALYRDAAMRCVEAGQFPGAPDREKAQAHVERLLATVDDESASLARRVIATSSPTYDRAFGKAVRAMSRDGLTAEESRALQLGTDSEGGFAVPVQLDPTVILTSDGVIDPLRAISRVEQITGKEWQGITSSGITVTRKAEEAESTDNSPSLGQPTVTTSRVDGFVPFSVELEQDWARMKGELTMLLAEAKADEEADSFVNGDGTANAGSGNEPEGILTGVTAVVETAATSLTRADLIKVKNALGPRFRARAHWLAETSTFDAVRALDEDGDVWSALADGLTERILGRPIAEASEMPAFATTAGSVLAVFGDFSKFLIVDRLGMNVELVPHLFGANRRPTGQRGLYVWWRNGSKVLVPNAFRKLIINDGV